MEIIGELIEAMKGLEGFLKFLSLAFVAVLGLAVYFFRPSTTVAVKVGVFFSIVFLFLIILALGAYSEFGSSLMSSTSHSDQVQSSTLQKPQQPLDQPVESNDPPNIKAGEQCKENNPSLECLWIQ